MKWRLQSGVSVRRDFSAEARKRSAADIVRTYARGEVALRVHKIVRVRVYCVSENSYLYHHTGEPDVI